MATMQDTIQQLYDTFGQKKPMGLTAPSSKLPHFFLQRNFLGEQDLLIIFNTKRCRYQCNFCDLPRKSSLAYVSSDHILAQFEYVMTELKHSLSVLERFTISNEGSVLDEGTFPRDALLTIVECSQILRRVRTLVLETRLEFVDPYYIEQLHLANPRASLDILTGFETVDPFIRDSLLHKREPLDAFVSGLDRVADSHSRLTAYVLFKPSPTMTDEEGYREAESSIDFLADQCARRNIPLTIRLNPMYASKQSGWTRLARATAEYLPPRLSDVLSLAEKKAAQGLRIYIGLSTEGLNEQWGSYTVREDFSAELLKRAVIFNQRTLSLDATADLLQLI